MKARGSTRKLAAGLFSWALLASGPPAGAQDLGRKIDAYLKPLVEANNFIGVVHVTRGDRVLFEKGYGLANGELNVPNGPETRFHIASVSKAFTAAAILLLEERGQLAVSSPVSTYLPDYPNGDKITLEHLLTHSSGIPNVNSFPDYDRESFFPHTLPQIVSLFRDKPLDFEPGTNHRYSNSNYNLLALVIETVSGQSYGDFLKANIFEPLSLRTTLHDGEASMPIPNRATGMEPQGLRGLKLAPRIDWSIKTGNGSLVTTAADLAKFARSIFEGRLLRPASLAKIMASGPVFPYGWTDRARSGRKLKGAGGRSPGFVSNVDYVLADGTCIIVLSNSYSPVAQDPVAPAIEAIVAGETARSEPTAPVAPAAGELAAVAGRYQMPEDYYVPGIILTLLDRGQYLEALWGNSSSTVIYPVGTGQYLDRSYWARVRFARDETGKVTDLLYTSGREFKAKKLF
jgi:CubicO group peptidase (beta-lactamase class C family)